MITIPVYYRGEATGHGTLKKLSGREIATVRILKYIDRSDLELSDPNIRGETVWSNLLRCSVNI